MRRRDFLKAIGLGACMAFPPFASGNTAKPNVLFISVDDMNDWVGCLDGREDSKTPNIDRLAGRGVLFTNAHCPAPLCNPCRTAIMTGLRPGTTDIYNRWFSSPMGRWAMNSSSWN